MSRLVIFALLLASTILAVVPASPSKRLLLEQADGFAGAEADTAYHLPTNVIPTYYIVVIVFGSFSSNDFLVNAQIAVNVVSDTNEITLHAKELTINNNLVRVYDGNQVISTESTVLQMATNITSNPEDETITIKFRDALQAGMRYWLQIPSITGKVNSQPPGIYRASYTSNQESRSLLATQFFPRGARMVFPCFDEPTFKTRFTLTILFKDAAVLNTISNMPITSKTNATSSSAYYSSRFPGTPIMSINKAAFIIQPDLQCYPEKSAGDGVSMRACGREEVVRDAAFVQGVGQLALEALADWTDIPYSLPEARQVGLPVLQGTGTNYWGIFTSSEEYLAVTTETPILWRQRVAMNACQQVAQQWASGLVTPETPDSQWLHDGLATYWQLLSCGQAYSNRKFDDSNFVSIALQPAMASDENFESLNSWNYDETVSDDVLSNYKVAAVFRMFENMMESGEFKSGLRLFLKQNSFMTVSPEKLYKAIGKVVHRGTAGALPDSAEFQDVASTWLGSKGRVEHPVVLVRREGGQVTLTQCQYSQLESLSSVQCSSAAGQQQRWWIPISYVTAKDVSENSTENHQAKAWLSPATNGTTITVEASGDQWLLVNPSQTGYYRVNYDRKGWQLLHTALLRDPSDFTASSRSQLLDDSFSLAEANFLDFGTVLSVTKFLEKEEELAPWITAARVLNALASHLWTTEIFDKFKSHVQDLTKEAYKKVRFQVMSDDTDEVRLRRHYLTNLACEFGLEDCLKDAAQTLSGWLQDPNNRIHADVRKAALCHGVRGGDHTTFEKMKLKWLDAAASADVSRLEYLSALACSSDANLLSSFLEDVISASPKLNKDSAKEAIDAVRDHYENLQVVENFVFDKISEIDTFFGGDSYSYDLLCHIVSHLQSPVDLRNFSNKAESKLKEWTKFSDLKATWTKAESSFKLKWQGQHYHQMESWFTAPVTSAPDETTAYPNSESTQILQSTPPVTSAPDETTTYPNSESTQILQSTPTHSRTTKHKGRPTPLLSTASYAFSSSTFLLAVSIVVALV